MSSGMRDAYSGRMFGAQKGFAPEVATMTELDLEGIRERNNRWLFQAEDVEMIASDAIRDRGALLTEVERLRAVLARVEALASEVANDLEAEINARYHGPADVHPALVSKYDRDMAPIRELRAALPATEVQRIRDMADDCARRRSNGIETG